MHVRLGPEAGHWLGREPPQAGPARLERARLQHLVTAPEDLKHGHHSTPEPRAPAPADRQHGCEDTGLKVNGKSKKHGADYRRQWRKVHLSVDAQTLEIRAIEVTDSANGNAPMLSQLLAQIPEDELRCSVSADGAYDTKVSHEAIAHRHATAIIPTRRNAKPWVESRAGARARNDILRATRELGRSI